MKSSQILFLVLAIASMLFIGRAVGAEGDPKTQPEGGAGGGGDESGGGGESGGAKGGGPQPNPSGQGGKKPSKDSNLIALYDKLHSFALPNMDPSEAVTQRFILQIPGKVLDPMEYYPGPEYEDFLKDPNGNKPEVHILPRVMEKMFQLSDIVPGANPLTGGETGYSLARVYESILGTMDVVDFDELTKVGMNVYKEGLDKLLEPLPDPDKSGEQVPLLQLYSRFQDYYHEEQRKMEDTIKEMQKNLSAVEYQMWFQRHFSILNAKVESAYTRWLLYGRKHLVESYIAHFDITSSGEILEGARIALRASGFTAQDRSQTVYPVSFTPGNWFKYLKRHEAPLTRDQLQAKLEHVKTRITLLKGMRDKMLSKELTEKDKTPLTDKKNEVKGTLDKSVGELEGMRESCWVGGNYESCSKINAMEDKLVETLSKSTAANLQLEMLKSQVGAESQMIGQINVVLETLEREKKNLEKELAEAKKNPSSGSGLVEDMGKSEKLSLEEMQDNWASFDFSSTTTSQESKSSGTQTSTKASVGSLFPFVGPKVDVAASTEHTSLSSHLSNVNLKVKAKLLKVKINRPWFRPDLFSNRDFKLQRTGSQVSPGPKPEDEFYTEVTKSDYSYLLYQYPTAFLLAKDISMEFSGLDAQSKQAALSASMGASGRGSYGPVSFGGSVSAAGKHEHTQASSTADGLKIDIPGAQIIGYYCDVVPKFPNPIKLEERMAK